VHFNSELQLHCKYYYIGSAYTLECWCCTSCRQAYSYALHLIILKYQIISHKLLGGLPVEQVGHLKKWSHPAVVWWLSAVCPMPISPQQSQIEP